MLVGGVKPGSVGERLGLRRGDIIIEINLRPVRNVAELGQALSGLLLGDRVVVAFQRGQGEFKAEAVR